MENTGISMFRCPEPMHLELPSTTFGHGRGAAGTSGALTRPSRRLRSTPERRLRRRGLGYPQADTSGAHLRV